MVTILRSIVWIAATSAALESFANAGPLHDAAQAGRLEQVRTLVRAGAQIDEPNVRGLTPPNLAALARHFEIMELLVTSGANVNARSPEGATALHLSVTGQHG